MSELRHFLILFHYKLSSDFDPFASIICSGRELEYLDLDFSALLGQIPFGLRMSPLSMGKQTRSSFNSGYRGALSSSATHNHFYPRQRISRLKAKKLCLLSLYKFSNSMVANETVVVKPSIHFGQLCKSCIAALTYIQTWC